MFFNSEVCLNGRFVLGNLLEISQKYQNYKMFRNQTAFDSYFSSSSWSLSEDGMFGMTAHGNLPHYLIGVYLEYVF